MTLGELSDLIAARRYRDYLEARRDARLACWIANGSGMRTEALHVEDLVGYWVDGAVMTKMAYYDHSKKKVLERRGVR